VEDTWTWGDKTELETQPCGTGKKVWMYGDYGDAEEVKTNYFTAYLLPIQYNEQILQPVFSHTPLTFGFM